MIMMMAVRLLSVLVLVLQSAESHNDGSGNSHAHSKHGDDVDPATIKLHRLANDPLLEDVKQLKSILDSGVADIDYQHPSSGQTPLMSACLNGKAETVKSLLSAGANPLVPEKDGYTPPHGAGFQGRAEVLKVLKAAGTIDIMDVHADGYTPFHRACWGKEPRHTDFVKLMVEEYDVDPLLPSQPATEEGGQTGGKTCAEMTHNQGTKDFLVGYSKGSAKDPKEL